MSGKADHKEIQQRAEELKSYYSAQQTLFNSMEDMFFMRDPDEAHNARVMDDVKLTVSPDARNAILGAQRLLVATDPTLRVTANDMSESQSGRIEKALESMWRASGKIGGSPVHYDLVLSGLLYDRVHLAITNTDDLVKWSAKRSKAYQARAKAIAMRTPFTFDVWNPAECYPLFDRQGLAAHLRSVEITVADIRGSYGNVGQLEEHKATDKVVLNEWWDLEYHVCWVEGSNEPLINEAHNLVAIPVVVGIVNGSSSLFVDPEDQLQPFLYTLSQSNLWKRQNLALTVMYTMVAKIGSNPLLVFKTTEADRILKIDYDNPGGIIKIMANEDLYPLNKLAIDPSIPEALRLADEKGTESTIYKQALGQSLGAGAPYSSVALLSQAGRLPLISPQKRIGWVIGRAFEIVLSWMKSDNMIRKYGQDEIKGADLPDDLEVECNLDIAMPQDYIQSAQLAVALAGGDRPIASMEWVRDRVLKIGQNSDIQSQIWNEIAGEQMHRIYVQDLMQQAQAKQTMVEQQRQAMQQQPSMSGGPGKTLSMQPQETMPIMPGQGIAPGNMLPGMLGGENGQQSEYRSKQMP